MVKIGDSVPEEFILARQLAEFKARNTICPVQGGEGRFDWTRSRRSARRKARRNTSK